MENLTHVCIQQADIATTKAFAKRCFNSIHGNGKEGLITTTTKQGEAIKENEKEIGEIKKELKETCKQKDLEELKAVISRNNESIEKLVNLQQDRSAIEKYKRKTLLLACTITSTIVGVFGLILAIVF